MFMRPGFVSNVIQVFNNLTVLFWIWFFFGGGRLLVLYITKRSILKSLPTLGIFPFLLCQFCFMNFEVLLLGAFQFRIVRIIHLPGVFDFV